MHMHYSKDIAVNELELQVELHLPVTLALVELVGAPLRSECTPSRTAA